VEDPFQGFLDFYGTNAIEEIIEKVTEDP